MKANVYLPLVSSPASVYRMPAQTGASGVPAAIRKRLATEYDKAGFMDRYGSDLWLVVIVFTCVLVHVFWYQVKNLLHSLKTNWVENRNNPLYMPIAGYVHRDPGETPGEATMKNFNASLGRVITEVVKVFMIPLLFIMSAISELVTVLLAVLDAIRKLFNYIRNMITNIIQDVIGRAVASVVPVLGMMHSAQGMMAKGGGLLAGLSYIGSGGFLTAGAALLWLIVLVGVILLIVSVFLAAMIAYAIAIFPTGTPFGWPGIIESLAILTISIIPAILLFVIVDPLYLFSSKVVYRVLDAHAASAPSLPMCFDGSTLIELANETTPVPLRDIQPGAVLEIGGTVTAVFKLCAQGQDVCKLGSTIVTGNHSVLHPAKGWIAARDHPDSIPLPDYNAEHVYCMNTSSKRIYLDGMTFADWDDLDEADFETLQYSTAPLPERFGPQDIHPYLSSGFSPDDKVQLADSSSTRIAEVGIGARLRGGGICMGCVKLLPVRSGGGSTIRHHLVVDTGRFMVNGSWTPHYDACIETYLNTPDQSPRNFLSSAFL